MDFDKALGGHLSGQIAIMLFNYVNVQVEDPYHGKPEADYDWFTNLSGMTRQMFSRLCGKY